MKKLGLFSVVLIVLVTATLNVIAIDEEEENVKDVIVKGYVHGAFNELNPEAMAIAFHEDFAIFSPGRNGEIRRYPIANWIENTKRQKSDPDFDASKNVWEYQFSSVDVTGNSAAVKLELYNEGKHVYTDYLSLLRFGDDWKIVAKVFHQH